MTKKKETNYQALFYMGITFVGTGVVFLAAVSRAIGAALITVGILNMIIGGKHKETWKNKK